LNDVKLQILLTAQEQTRAAFDAVNKRMTGMASAANLLKGAFAGMLAGVSIGAVVSGINQVADAASNMQETVSKINTLFGGAQGAVLEEWASGAAKSMGLAKQEALDAVGTMGNMFLQLGANTQKASDLSTGMVDLSADIASFHNVAGGANEVLGAMQAAFRGEYDALQRYIPTINAAAVEQAALAETGKKSAKELTNLEKAMAAYTIITRDAGAATGDFERTSEGLANQQRTLESHLANITARIGTGVVPGYTSAAGALNDWIEKNDEFSRQIDTLTTGLRAVGDAVAFVARHSDKVMKMFEIMTHSTLGPLKSAIDLYGAMNDTGQDERYGPRTIKIGAGTPVFDPAKTGGGTGGVVPDPNEVAKSIEKIDDMLTSFFDDLDERYQSLDQFVTHEFIDVDRLEVQIGRADDLLKDFFDDLDKYQAESRTAQAGNVITFELDTWFGDLDKAEDKLRKTSSAMVDLSQHTAELMQDNLSSLFLDTWRDDLDSFKDYFARIFESLQKIVSDSLAQMGAEWISSGIKSGASGLSSFLSGLLGGAGASTAYTPGAYGMANGGVIAEHVVGVGLRSGRSYEFGEGGSSEVVLPMRSGSSQAQGSSGGGVALTINVQAIDAQSGMDFLRRNGAGVAAALVNEMKHSYELSRLLKAT